MPRARSHAEGQRQPLFALDAVDLLHREFPEGRAHAVAARDRARVDAMTTRTMTTTRRFQILQRDGFECQFCGSRPGNDQLNVAHLFPHSRGGTEHDNNLTTACARCNNGISSTIAIPSRLCTPDTDAEGWRVWKRWGKWALCWSTEEDEIVLVFQPLDYWIAIKRVHEEDWHDHLDEKPWMRSASDRGRDSDWVDRHYDKANWPNFCEAIAFARTLVTRRRR